MGVVALALTVLSHGPYTGSGASASDAMIVQVFILVSFLTALGVGTLSDRIDHLVGELESSLCESAGRADLLQGLGRLDEARSEFERAASLTRNGREQALLRARAAACASGSPSSSANQGIRSSR